MPNTETPAAPRNTEEQLVGRVIEVGDIECLQDESGEPKAGLLIETTQEALRDFPLNLAFAEVVITIKANNALRINEEAPCE
jgi:hypothetical protein